MTYFRFNDTPALLLNASILRYIDYAIVGIGGAVVLIGLIRWLIRDSKDPLRFAPSRPNTLTPELAILPFLIWMVGSYLSEGIVSAINHRATGPTIPDDLNKLIMATGGQLAGILACLWVGRTFFQEGLAGFGFRRQGFLTDVGITILLMLAVIPLLYLLNEITASVISLFEKDFEPPPHKLLRTLETKEHPDWATPVLWMSAVLIAPIAEELFFRGIIQTGLRHVFSEGVFAARKEGQPFPVVVQDGETADPADDDPVDPHKEKANLDSHRVRRSQGKWPAILATGFIFGMVHYPQPHAVPALILFGIVLGFAYEKRGSLIPCIGMHVLFNLKTMIWFSLRGLS
jgi:membrane protease YdiL (CAAX protease family)